MNDPNAEPQVVGYAFTSVERQSDGYVRSYTFNTYPDGQISLEESPEFAKEKIVPALGDLPRVLIIGPQRLTAEDDNANNALEFRFVEAKVKLKANGRQGLFVRFATFERTDPSGGRVGVRIWPGGGGFVPTATWQKEVESRMQHCEGVALLDGAEDSSAVQWEIDLARRLEKPVHPLHYWLS